MYNILHDISYFYSLHGILNHEFMYLYSVYGILILET